jgi:hypothetical protein
MNKILIVLQCYTGDRMMAMKLARLIADIEQEKSRYADFMIAYRYDTQDDIGTYLYLTKKFDEVHLYHSRHNTSGWPAGCNDLFFDTLAHISRMVKKNGWEYDAALFIEADCVPLDKDWIKKLHREWYAGTQLALGHWISKSQFRTAHLNGNCMLATNISEKIPSFYTCPPSHPWDIFHTKALWANMRATDLIFSDYKKKTITEDELFSARTYPKDHPLRAMSSVPVLIHGVKDESAQIIVRKKFFHHP